MLRFLICGGSEVGKSALIGRLLSEAGALHEDRIAGETEHGITIGVAYRRFATANRSFIVGDTSSPEWHVRSAIAAASAADVAVILVDALKGVVTETRRHSYLASLLHVRKVVVAVNKLDMVGYSGNVFDSIEREYRKFATQVAIDELTFIPISALNGDNVSRRSANTHWYDGPSLMEYLDGVDVNYRVQDGPFRMFVQAVNRLGQGSRSVRAHRRWRHPPGRAPACAARRQGRYRHTHRDR